jgi:hypothetical protein
MSSATTLISSENTQADSLAQETLKANRSFSKGFVLVALGAVILLGSCLFSLTLNFSDPSFHYILYGATTFGALLVLVGLGCCLGW